MEAEEIAERSRRSISKFCYEECDAFCCRKGCLDVTKKEADLITQKGKIRLEDKKVIKKTDGSYSLNLNDNCPCLKDNKCIIHDNPDRPKVCDEFPIFIKDKKIIFSPGCLAVKKELFYPYVHEFLKLGYKIF